MFWYNWYGIKATMHVFYREYDKALLPYISMYIQKAHPGCQNYYVRSVNVGLVRHFAVRFMTRKSRIEMKDDHRNGNNQKFGKHSACHKIHHGVRRTAPPPPPRWCVLSVRQGRQFEWFATAIHNDANVEKNLGSSIGI